ncbi:MAG TPA: hypothetical protein DCL77_04340, partial [Prolixibacteraceae bacterium]|nr:hypothetical protein [Prolixibacteraceae bacterium]
MKLFISICCFVVFILNAQPGFSQKEIEVSGKKYLLHEVQKGETAYGLCVKYNVTQAELLDANPDLTAVLKSGTTIKIPVKKEATAVKKTEPSIAKAVAPEPEYYYHKVTKEQTIYSIARQYGITTNELIRYNPEIASGLVAGKVLKVPVKKVDTTDSPVQTDAGLKIPQKNTPQATVKELPETAFEKYKVEKGETLFSLASRFGIEVGEIKKANPSLFARSLETGEIILIPKSSVAANTVKTEQEPVTRTASQAPQETDPGNCSPLAHNDKKYKVALLLPLYLPGNDQVNPSALNAETLLKHIDFSNRVNAVSVDSSTVSNGIVLDQRAESFLEFYEGALLAIDSLQKKGMNIELCVFDASNQNMINGLLQLDEFRELDLIIGPVYPELQQNVASFAAKNRIPMVSPLASTGNYEENNPWYFKVNPAKEYQIEQTAQYIASEFRDKNFILLPQSGNSNSTEVKLAEMAKDKLMAARQSKRNGKGLFHEYNFQTDGLNSVKPLLDDTGENVFMIPSDNEAQVSVAVTNLNALAENYNI